MSYTASVKVMRSYDYCHFEIALGSSDPIELTEVDAMRKQAARLADKAVEQYKIAKVNANKLSTEKSERAYLSREVERIRALEEGDRTVDQQAKLKAYDDLRWESSRRYDYEDDWDQDYSE